MWPDLDHLDQPRPNLVQTNPDSTSSPRPTSYIGRGNEATNETTNETPSDLDLVQSFGSRS